MKLNIGSTDRIIRIMLGIAIGYFAYSTVIEASWVQVLLYVIAVILVVTALIGNCPLYSIFKINTCEIEK